MNEHRIDWDLQTQEQEPEQAEDRLEELKKEVQKMPRWVSGIKINEEGQMSEIRLQDGTLLVGIAGAALKTQAKRDVNGNWLSELTIRVYGDFEIERPEVINRKPTLYGPDGKPL